MPDFFSHPNFIFYTLSLFFRSFHCRLFVIFFSSIYIQKKKVANDLAFVFPRGFVDVKFLQAGAIRYSSLGNVYVCSLSSIDSVLELSSGLNEIASLFAFSNGQEFRKTLVGEIACFTKSFQRATQTFLLGAFFGIILSSLFGPTSHFVGRLFCSLLFLRSLFRLKKTTVCRCKCYCYYFSRNQYI